MEWCGCGIYQNCDACFEYVIPYCPANPINVPTENLTNNVTYYLWIRDKFDKIYSDTVLGKSNGTFDINTSNFPTGMFTPNFGDIEMFLSTDNLGKQVVSLILNGNNYNCIIQGVDTPVYLTADDGCTILTDDNGNPLIAQ